MQEKIIRNFDRGATQYRANAGLQMIVAQTLCDQVPLLPEQAQILEIGCGDGLLTEMLAQKFPDAQILATDISPKMVAQTQRNLPHVQTAIMDAQKPDLDRKFDLIVANMSLQWASDINATLKNLSDFLKPDGVLLSSRPGPQSFPEWKKTLERLGLPIGIHDFPQSTHMLREEHIAHPYDSTLDFLRRMHKIGATTPRAAYQPLSPAQLRRACKACDAVSNGKNTWHILYERVFAA